MEIQNDSFFLDTKYTLKAYQGNILSAIHIFWIKKIVVTNEQNKNYQDWAEKYFVGC